MTHHDRDGDGFVPQTVHHGTRHLLASKGIDLDEFDAALREVARKREAWVQLQSSLARLNAAEAAADALAALLSAGAVAADAADYLAAKAAADAWRAAR